MSPSRWALITGVSPGGMGEGHANAFLKRGINVVATGIDMKFLEGLKLESGKNGAYPVRMQLDVTSTESIASAVERVENLTGRRLDFLMSKFASISCPLLSRLTTQTDCMLLVTQTTLDMATICLYWMSMLRRQRSNTKLMSGDC